MSRPRRSFSPEFKLRVVQEVEQGQSQAAVARKYELSPHLIPLWKKALSTGRLGGEATGGPSVEALLQDQQIKGEIIQTQTQEIHLLKKALATFSSSPSRSAASSAAIGPKSSRSKKPAR
jgi:transposase-like protein